MTRNKIQIAGLCFALLSISTGEAWSKDFDFQVARNVSKSLNRGSQRRPRLRKVTTAEAAAVRLQRKQMEGIASSLVTGALFNDRNMLGETRLRELPSTGTVSGRALQLEVLGHGRTDKVLVVDERARLRILETRELPGDRPGFKLHLRRLHPTDVSFHGLSLNGVRSLVEAAHANLTDPNAARVIWEHGVIERPSSFD